MSVRLILIVVAACGGGFNFNLPMLHKNWRWYFSSWLARLIVFGLMGWGISYLDLSQFLGPERSLIPLLGLLWILNTFLTGVEIIVYNLDRFGDERVDSIWPALVPFLLCLLLLVDSCISRTEEEKTMRDSQSTFFNL